MCDVQIFRPHFHIGRAIFNVSSLFHPSNFGELTPVRKTSEMITRTLYSDTIIVVLGKQKGKQKKITIFGSVLQFVSMLFVPDQC